MPAAGNQRLQLDPFVEHQRRRALGTEGLVRRERHGMHAGRIEGTKIKCPLAEGLNGVAVKPSAAGLRRTGQRGDILHHPGLVVGQHDRQELRPHRQCRDKIIVINPAVGIDGDFAQLPALTGKLGRRLEHAGMLDGTDRQPPGLQGSSSTFQEEVVRLAAAAGKDDFGGVRIDRRRHLLARLIDGPTGRPPELMATRRIAAQALKPGQHGRQDSRIERRRGVMVEIDGGKHGLAA